MDKSKVILPPATIGILGGGQLGRMMATVAREMGYRIITLDPTEDSPCGQVADRQIVAAFDSLEGAIELAKGSDVLTYEFENISAELAAHLEKNSYLPQGYDLLYTTQNRLREKTAIQKAGARVAPFRRVQSSSDVETAVRELGLPAVLKTTEGGYDGKGQWVLQSANQVNQVLPIVEQAKGEFILEQFVPFEKEISVIVARNGWGEVVPFPVAENIHQENILHLSIAPARIPQDIAERATQLAIQLAKEFQLVGLLAIEMFLQADGTIYVNELAPRPHNSGHYTQEACQTSQFEQHIRAICNLPLGRTEIVQPTVMVNILGEHLQPVLDRLANLDPAFKLHLYGKKEAKAKRKMGHLNVVAPTVEEALEKISALNIWT